MPHATHVVAAATMDVVEMVLGGRVNKGLVTLIQQAGGQAVGLCGKDSNIIRARQMVEKDIGFVGDITSVKKDLIEALVKEEYIPVVASVAADPLTGQALNVNADIAAGEVIRHCCRVTHTDSCRHVCKNAAGHLQCPCAGQRLVLARQ